MDLIAVRIVNESTGGTGLFQYFIRVMPTLYTDADGVVHRTNQYTTGERFRPFMLPQKPGEPMNPSVSAQPAIFFNCFYLFYR